MLKVIGVLGVVAGSLLICVGVVALLAGWRFGGLIFWFTVMFGTLLAGLGLILATSGSVVGPALGAALCGLSAVLIVLWERRGGHLGWLSYSRFLAAGGLVMGVVVSIRNRRRRISN